MKLSIIQECDAPNGVRPPISRYQELVREAIAAEEAGFSTYMVSEQHFNDTIATLSAPESFFGYLAAKTSTIRLRVGSFVLLSFNHPIRSAERAATLDVLSDGRFEIGTARSNNPQTLKIFGIDPNDTRAMWEESIQIIRGALTYENFEFHGQIWDVPPVTIMPRPVQLPHPPIYVSATSIETHFNSGRYGLGVMTGNSLPGGWDYLAEALGAYQKGLAEVDVAGGRLHRVPVGRWLLSRTALRPSKPLSTMRARSLAASSAWSCSGTTSSRPRPRITRRSPDCAPWSIGKTACLS